MEVMTAVQVKLTTGERRASMKKGQRTLMLFESIAGTGV